MGPRICSRAAHFPPHTRPSLRKMNKARTQMLGWVLDSRHGTRDSGSRAHSKDPFAHSSEHLPLEHALISRPDHRQRAGLRGSAACVRAHLRTPIAPLRVIQPTSRCTLIRAISLVTFFVKESDKKIFKITQAAGRLARGYISSFSHFLTRPLSHSISFFILPYFHIYILPNLSPQKNPPPLSDGSCCFRGKGN